jgi:hypothetical protein
MSSQGKQRTAIGFSVSFNESSVVELVQELAQQKENIPKAISAAVDRTGRSIKSMVLSAITSNINIKRKDIDGNSKGRHRYGGVYFRAYGIGSVRRATVTVTGHRIPVYRFGARPQLPPTRKTKAPSEPDPARKFKKRKRRKGIFKNGRPRKGVSFRISKGAGATTVKDAFVARMKSGHVGVFKRMKPGQSLPIAELFGPSIPQAALNDQKLQDGLKVDASDMLKKNLSSQIDRFLQRSRARAQAVTSG